MSAGTALRHRYAISATTMCCLALVLAGGVPQAWGAPFSGVMFEDAPAIDAAHLLPAYQAALGGAITPKLSRDVGRDLIRLYQRRGYLAPAPRLRHVIDEAGVLVMEMREPRVVRVHLNGREHVDADELEALARELRETRPLSRAAFDEWLERVSGLGAAVQGSLLEVEAGSAQYAATVNVTKRRWQGVVHLDNRGPSQLGHEIAQLSLVYRTSRESLGDFRLDAAAAVDTDRLRYAGVSGGHRLRERGERVYWSYARSESSLPIPRSSRFVDYQRARAALELRSPLVRRARQRADLTFGLRSYDLDQSLDDGRRLRRDRVRALQLGYGSTALRADGSRHTMELALARGLDTLGASLTPPQGEPDFLLFTGRYRYGRNVDVHWRLWGDLQVQASADRLPSSERFFIGGRNLGGAFDPATVSGDQGLGARVGVDRSLHLRGQPVTAFAYYDHGYVWSNDGAAPADDAGSVGLGLRGGYRQLSWTLELGVPARDPETPTLLENDPRVFFSLTQRF